MGHGPSGPWIPRTLASRGPHWPCQDLITAEKKWGSDLLEHQPPPPAACSYDRSHLCRRIGSSQKLSISCGVKHVDLVIRHRFVEFLRQKKDIGAIFISNIEKNLLYLKCPTLSCHSFQNTNYWCSVTLRASFPSKFCDSLKNNKDNSFLLRPRHMLNPFITHCFIKS